MSDYGSIKKLNWKEPKFHERVTKSESHEDYARQQRRYGTPPTRAGSFNGARPGFTPSLVVEESPTLYIGKAVLTPVKYGPTGPQFQRKRDSSGKFAPAQNLDHQTTAEEDQEEQQRQVKLRAAANKDKLKHAAEAAKKEMETKKAMPGNGYVPKLPGASDADAAVLGQGQDDLSNMMGGGQGPSTYKFTDDMAQANSPSAPGMGPGTPPGPNGAPSDQGLGAAPPAGNFLDQMTPPGAPGAPSPQPSLDNFMNLLGQDDSMAPMMPPQPQAPAQMGGAMPPMPGQPQAPAPTGLPNMGPSTAPAQPAPPSDPLASLMGGDQSKPLNPDVSRQGPKPGMFDNTAQSSPAGPGDEASLEDDPLDMDEDLMDNPLAGAPDVEVEDVGGEDSGTSSFGSSDDDGDSGNSDNPFGSSSEKTGSSDESNKFGSASDGDDDSDDSEKTNATFKAIKLLSRYLHG